jgi:hypothetical protein
MAVKRFMNTKRMKILEIMNGRNSDIDFVLQSSPSEDKAEDVLELSDDSDQPGLSKCEHYGTISPCAINCTVLFIF